MDGHHLRREATWILAWGGLEYQKFIRRYMCTGSYVFSGPVHVRLSLRPTRKAMPALSTFRSQDRSPLAPSIQSSICMNRRLGPSENGRRAKMVLFLGIFGFFRSRRFQCDFNTAKKYKIVALT